MPDLDASIHKGITYCHDNEFGALGSDESDNEDEKLGSEDTRFNTEGDDNQAGCIGNDKECSVCEGMSPLIWDCGHNSCSGCTYDDPAPMSHSRPMSPTNPTDDGAAAVVHTAFENKARRGQVGLANKKMQLFRKSPQNKTPDPVGTNGKNEGWRNLTIAVDSGAGENVIGPTTSKSTATIFARRPIRFEATASYRRQGRKLPTTAKSSFR